jgi:hypothetical protein
MKSFARISVVLTLILSLFFITIPVQAQSYSWFEITAPSNGSVFSLGQPVTIQWTGGDPEWSVNIYLIDVTRWTATGSTAMNIPNSGSFDGMFPTVLPEYLGGPCGHTYQFYVENVQRTMWTYGPYFTFSCDITITLDIKPGSFPNSINPRNQGVIPVAILSTSTFDAATVEPDSLKFGPSLASPRQFALEDVNNDGSPDLMLHFDTQATGIQCGDGTASLAGLTKTGKVIKGTDAIKTVGCK